MKRLLYILLIAMLALYLSGCGSSGNSGDIFIVQILSDQSADGDIAFDGVSYAIANSPDTLFFGIDESDINLPEYRAFLDNTGKRYKDIKRSFSTACRKSKIVDFHFHDQRHTFASHLVMSGVDITTVSRLIGHKSLKMTLRYAHLAPSHMQKAVDILDNTLTGNLSTIQSTIQSPKKELTING